jgi:NAD(P)-dependent dehydrogenase (short-subunit alcohol dehydrogenase family)
MSSIIIVADSLLDQEDPMGKHEGKVAVITGGTSGIGLATAQRLVSEGAYVFITGRRPNELEAAVKQIGRNVTGVQGDVAKLADLDRLYATVKEKKGAIDILFTNAGIARGAALGAITEEEFDSIFDVNVRGTLFTVQKALPLLREGASIVASKGFATRSVYSATKAAVRSFARTWASDLKGRKIRVNAVSPGPIDTAGLRGLQKADSDQLNAFFSGIAPLGRIGQPDEIAKAVSFLASDDSSYVTGTELFVDGGIAQI